VLKLAGAAYLVYLGVRLLFSKAAAAAIPGGFERGDFAATFRQGLLTNLLNPKVALFFLAFMPQFIAVDSPSKPLAFLLLGLCFVATGTTWCLCLAWFASAFSERLRGSSTLTDVLNRAAGTLFVILGVRLATAK
jgi:threonine/homoserine/homoserine lactone efflux protein